MTREQQKQLRELKLALPKMIRQLAGEKKIKKKDFMLYQKRNGLFFDCMISISVTEDNECICSSLERLKPMWIDDLLWELLDMESNKKEPDSLRAVGAFAVYGAPVYEKRTVLKEWTEDELLKIVTGYIDHFSDSIESADNTLFEEMLSKGYHGELRTALYFIKNKEYQKVLDVVGDESGCFTNGSLNIYDAIRDYCRSSQEH